MALQDPRLAFLPMLGQCMKKLHMCLTPVEPKVVQFLYNYVYFITYSEARNSPQTICFPFCSVPSSDDDSDSQLSYPWAPAGIPRGGPKPPPG